MRATKTTYEVDGCNEPCWIVSDDEGFCKVRISTCYHYIGKNTLYMNEYLDGEWNDSDEFIGDFELLDESSAMHLAREFSAYLH